jgi:hypothetical protein
MVRRTNNQSDVINRLLNGIKVDKSYYWSSLCFVHTHFFRPPTWIAIHLIRRGKNICIDVKSQIFLK